MYEILVSKYGEVPTRPEETDIFRACREAGLLSVTLEKEVANSESSTKSEENLELWVEISGMSCPSCSWLLEKLLEKLGGVKKAEVSFGADLARIIYDPSSITPQRITERIGSWGYKAVPSAHGEEYPEGDSEGLTRLCVAALLTCQVMMISWALYWGFLEDIGNWGIKYISLPLFAFSTPVVFWCGASLLKKGIAGIKALMPNVESLVALGSLSAYFYSLHGFTKGSLHLYFDTSCMLITTVLLGRYIEQRMRRKLGESSILEMRRLSRFKARLLENGLEKWVPGREVRKGQEVKVREGETIPVDGTVSRGGALVDRSFLTGESTPMTLTPGQHALAGSLVLKGEVSILANGPSDYSLLSEMASSIRTAMSKRTSWDGIAQRGLRWFVPGVLVLGLVNSLLLLLSNHPVGDALIRGLTVWIVACPCALGIAIPLAKVAALTLGRKEGIIVRNPEVFEKGGRLDEMLLDKTGTVTEGTFTIREIYCPGQKVEELLSMAASVEAGSDHLLAKKIVGLALGKKIRLLEVHDFHEEKGLGVMGCISEKNVFVGSDLWMREKGLAIAEGLLQRAREYQTKGLTVVFVAWNGSAKGIVALGDSPRHDALELVRGLRQRRIKVRLVSGDSELTTKAIAGELGITEFSAQMMPDEKARLVRELGAEGKVVGAVGDGVNDGPALALAQMGIAVGGRAGGAGSGADVWIPSGELKRILKTLDLCHAGRRTVIQNLILSALYNSLAIGAALGGFLNPPLAVGAMFASSLSVVANSWRLSRSSLSYSVVPSEKSENLTVQYQATEAS